MLKNTRNKLMIDTDFIFQSLLTRTNDYVYVCNLSQGFYVLSDNMAEDFALEKEGIHFIDKWRSCIHKRDSERIEYGIGQIIKSKKNKMNFEYQVTNARGIPIWLSDKSTIQYNAETNEPELIIGILHNLAMDGTVDSVTGLLMHEKYEELFELSQLNKVDFYGSIMLLGIDDFTAINTLNNHSFGDLVLRTTAQDILNILPEHASMYRFDGDQFLISGEKMDKNQLCEIYEDIKAYTANPHQIHEFSYRFTISAGLISYPEDGYSWSDLEKAVSTALRKAKEHGKNQCVYFQKEMLEKRMYEQSLGRYLADSIDHGFKGFKVVFQPMCFAQNLKLKGAEALLRFETPQGDLISPLQFIPLLEQSGLIHAAGLWVLEQAISTCKKWSCYMGDFVMNVNVSYIQLRDIDFCDHVEALLQKYDLDIRHLTLELTESYFITDAPNINQSIKRLQELHLQVAMDDFGTGYSSLARLSQFNVDVVKIDRSFIQSLHKSKYNYDFVDSVVRLCHNVGMKVCVEGVETREEQTSICLLNADYIQGFYVEKPIEEQLFFTKFILQPEANQSLVVTPNHLSHSQLVGDKDVLLSMMDASPLALNFWNRSHEIMACNVIVLRLFDAVNFDDFKENFYNYSPEYQPDGQNSRDKASYLLTRAFNGEHVNTIWTHLTKKGELFPAEVDFVRIPYMGDYIVASYTRDMRQQRKMEERIEKFNLRLKAILDSTPLCLNLWNLKFQNTMCNKEAITLFGLKSEEEYTQNFFHMSPEYQPDGHLSIEKASMKIKEAFETGRCQFYWTHCNVLGEEIPCEITLVRIDDLDEDGGPLVAGYTRDIRGQLEAQSIQKKAAERIRAVLDSMPLACILWTLNTTIVDCNQGSVNLFGAIDKQDVITNFESFNPTYQPDNSNSVVKKAAKFEETLKNGFSIFEWVYTSKSGKELPCEVTLVRIKLDYEELIVAYSRDLRELHQTLELNDRLAKLAYFDLLTGCASRMKFMEKLAQNFASPGKETLAFIIFDIDYFKSINDTYGHPAGDMVLKYVAKSIDKLLPANALLGRFGGDEFTIQTVGIEPVRLKKLLDTLVSHIDSLRLHYEGQTISTTISAGASFKTPQDHNYEELLIRADKALYEAKARGRNQGVIF